jgi:hypothetical protein
MSKAAQGDKMNESISLRFRDFPVGSDMSGLKSLIELASEREVKICQDISKIVDVEITGPYGGVSDSYKTPFIKRASRGVFSKFTKGEHVSIPSLAVGLTPNPLARVNIWYTGENERPPFGKWDLLLGFDAKLPSKNNFYLPLWIFTSTDLIAKLDTSFWGRNEPTIVELLKSRELKEQKKKFACAFIGKNYPMRLHAINELRKIGKVDVFGQGSRRKVERPSDIAKQYRFTICFENDLYPGYVTEKPFEAYLAGTIPIYYGIDSEKFLNPLALLNLDNFDSLDEWLFRIDKLNSDQILYESTYSQPLLLKSPDLGDLLKLLRLKLSEL